MPEFGMTGRWLFVPVTMCVGLLGAYFLFTEVSTVFTRLFFGSETILSVNGVGTIFGRPPPASLRDQFPTLSMTPHIIWLANIVYAQSIVLVFIGFWSICALLCPWPFMAKTLFYAALAYASLWVAAHIGVFYCHRKHLLLECSPEYRAQTGQMHVLFGEYRWPNSFWYFYGTKAITIIWCIYMVVNLYYSWYMILKVGGSGWENMEAQDLPGWEDYQKRKYEIEKARAKMRGEFFDDDDEDEEAASQLPIEVLRQIAEQRTRQRDDPMAAPDLGGLPLLQGLSPDMANVLFDKGFPPPQALPANGSSRGMLNNIVPGSAEEEQLMSTPAPT